MRYYRVRSGDRVAYARAEDEAADPYPADARLRLLAGDDPYDGLTDTDEVVDRDAVEVLAPAVPSKYVGVARNFAAHADEREKEVPAEPLIFLKPPTCVVPSGTPIVRPPACQLLNYEGELALVIGRRCYAVDEAAALDHVWGYTVANDVTARDIQNRENAFVRAKGYDTFGPLGPCVVTGIDPTTLSVETRVNGELCQEGRIADLVHPIPKLIAFISGIMTLEPGDVIATGTPRGMRPIEPGDTVEVSIAGIGRLSNPVVAPA